MKPRTIAGAWRDFEAEVVPLDAPKIQRDEMRKAFYSGALSLLTLVFVELSPGDEANPSDLALMQTIHAELEAFRRSL